MLTLTELVALERSLRDAPVLSVYIDGTAHDPAIQRAWRLQLDHALDDLRTWLADSSHDERARFAKCVALLEEQLGAFTGGIGAPGWAAFITSDGVRHAELVPVPMPTMAVWSTGPSIAPYVRALKQLRPVIVAVMDARKVALYRYQAGQAERVETLHAQHVVEAPSHMGDAPRPGFHPGTRGSTGQDEAQRSLLEGTRRMLHDFAERALSLAGSEGWILLGGIPRVTAHAAEMLSPVAERVLRLESLDAHASAAEVAEAARVGASSLRTAADARQIGEIFGQADAGRLGVTGALPTQRALEQACVRALCVSERFVLDHAAEAEAAVRQALEQDAAVEEVTGAAAERLDARGGIAALLRFRPETIEPAPMTTASRESVPGAPPG